MRIKIDFTETKERLPINNQHLVNSYIHRVLGNNNKYHDAKSDYSISQLCGGKRNVDDNTLSFGNNPYIIITSDNAEFLNKIILGSMNTPDFYSGIKFKNMSFIEEEFYNGWNHFFTLSPILLKEQARGERVKFITINDLDYGDKLKSHMVNKLSKIDATLDLSDFEISIGTKVRKVRKVLVKNVINHASSIQISIKTNKAVASKLYNLGLGQSTGSGFGTIYKTENYELFKF